MGLAQQTADVCRAVWNTGLEQRRDYRRRGAWMSYEVQAHELVDAKREHTWLTTVPSHCLQQALRDLDQACRKHDTFRVRWRSARKWVPSFRFPEGSKMELRKLNRRKSAVKLPKLGWVKFRASRSIDCETIRSATLTREGQHWFVSILVEDGVTTPTQHAAPGSAVGVDRGVAVAVATSAGDLLDRVFTTPAEQWRVSGRRAVGGVSLWRRPVACGLRAFPEAGTSRKPRGITAPTRDQGWNPAGIILRRTSMQHVGRVPACAGLVVWSTGSPPSHRNG
jgi:transposase